VHDKETKIAYHSRRGICGWHRPPFGPAIISGVGLRFLSSTAVRFSRSEGETCPNHGFGNNVASIWSTSDKNPEGKINNQEICTSFNNDDLAKQTANSPEIMQQDHIIKEYPYKSGEHLNNIIMITTPMSINLNNM
jgi:hypothetical protein